MMRLSWTRERDGSGPPRVMVLSSALGLAVLGVVFMIGAAPALGTSGPMRSAAPSAPSPPVSERYADLDRDNVADVEDPCPASAGRRRSSVRGCSLTDALARPQVLIEPIAAGVSQAAASLPRSPRVRAPAVRAGLFLQRASSLASQGLAHLDDGTPCAASTDALRAVSTAGRAERDFARAVAALRRSFTRRGAGGARGDFDARDAQLLEANVSLQNVKRVTAELARLRKLLAPLCKRRAKPRVVSGRVATLDNAGQSARLDSGQTLYLGGLRRAHPLAKGVAVRVTGLRLADGLLATDVRFPGSAATRPPLEGIKRACVALRVAPDQLPQGKVLHDIAGYTSGSRVNLEQSSRLGVQSIAPACATKIGDKTMHYGMTISLTYERAKGGGKTTAVLATSLQDTEFPVPVPLPADISPSTLATLTTTTHVYGCVPHPLDTKHHPKAPVCDAPQTAEKQTYPATVRAAGHYGRVSYARNIFTIDDQDPAGVGITTLSGFQPSHADELSDAQGLGVQGLGHPANGGQFSAAVTVIPLGGQFAVHNMFGSPYGSSGPFKGPIGGLLKARLTGTRNGHPFWYSLERDWVTTDATTLCSPINAFYRLPWAAGTARTVTQGNNNPKFTHKGGQKFAFDFDHPMHTPIHAVRGGKVVFVEEDLTKNSNPNKKEPWVPANALRIRHMDGTTSTYYHMRPKGVAVDVGDTVHRGELVAFSGNTGNSTGPHLHFQVDTYAENTTHPIRFDGAAPFTGQPFSCLLPSKGMTLVSTNK